MAKQTLSKTRLYSIYTNMKQRCYNPNNPKYSNYGGKGVIICDEWLNDFRTFYDWANANGYSDELTIDRIDPNGNYCPENCRWVTLQENISRIRYTDNPRNQKIGFRMSQAEIDDIEKCAAALGTQRVNAIVEGINLLKQKLNID